MGKVRGQRTRVGVKGDGEDGETWMKEEGEGVCVYQCHSRELHNVEKKRGSVNKIATGGRREFTQRREDVVRSARRARRVRRDDVL